jgi:protease I
VPERLNGRQVAFLVANEGTEQVELTTPWRVVAHAGGRPVLVAPAAGFVEVVHGDARVARFQVDLTTDEADVDAFAAVVLPGGVMAADRLRLDRAAVRLVRDACRSGRAVAAIGHSVWTLVEADVVRGRVLTSWPSLRKDVENAGGTWNDADVQVCANGPNTLVTSRRAEDLTAFCKELLRACAAVPAGHHGQRRGRIA